MPFIMQIYVIFFTLIVIANIAYSIKMKVKLWTIIYELFSGPFLLFLTLAYWSEALKSSIGIGILIPFGCVICFDFYFTVWGKSEQLSDLLQDIDKKDLETAKALSVAFTAPVYITSALLCAELITS